MIITLVLFVLIHQLIFLTLYRNIFYRCIEVSHKKAHMRMQTHMPWYVKQSVNSIWRQLMDAVFCFLSFLFDVAVFLELFADVFLQQKGRFRRKSNNKTLHMITWFFFVRLQSLSNECGILNPSALICHRKYCKNGL